MYASDAMNYYQLGSVIGKGSEGTVYHGKRISLPDKAFAIKRVSLPPPDQRESRNIVMSRIMYASECQRYMSARSCHTVPVHDVVVLRHCAYIAQDLMDQGTLCHNTTLTLAETKHVLHVLAKALKDCHDNGICYGDVKAENVGLKKNIHTGLTEPQLFDFGCSLDCFSPTKGCKLRHGTLMYSAPEVVEQKDHGYNVDVFSYAVLVHVLLSDNRFPWPRLHFKSWEASYIEQYHQVPDLAHMGEPGVEALLARALSHVMTDRPSFRQIVDATSHWRLSAKP